MLLRDPASRAYSHYWHLVRTGRVGVSFEKALMASPHRLLDRGVYTPQIENLRSALPDEAVHLLTFEEFVGDTQRAVDRVLAFLGVAEPLDVTTVNTHSNAVQTARWTWLELLRNRLLGRLTHRLYDAHFHPEAAPSPPPLGYHVKKALSGAHRLINPRTRNRPPAMRPETREMLDEYYRVENQGLDEVVGRPVTDQWGRSRSDA